MTKQYSHDQQEKDDRKVAESIAILLRAFERFDRKCWDLIEDRHYNKLKLIKSHLLEIQAYYRKEEK